MLVSAPRRRGRIAYQLTRMMVRAAGGETRRVRPRDGEIPWDDARAVILGGGEDIDPRRYREEAEVEARLDPERDALEWALLDGAVRRRLPVLGICRGAQLLNVYLGGTLFQDLRAEFPRHSPRRQLLARKHITVDARSRLHRALGATSLRVNSLHSQGIAALGRGLRVCARDHLGVVQGVERRAAPLCVGVQWHPELLPARAEQRRLFAALVRAAREGETARPSDATI
ncbi:MAG: hypothetical protein SangKO_014270 [Sandaracinaceae bacterium]